ncbi:MAG: NADH-quinone oxidoreductase subunit NuoN [Gammaproteobacteria bacterium]|jgi:NADH-quinone oxidoreductase subunit N
MSPSLPNFLPAVPEMFVLGMACLILVVDLFLKDEQRDATYLLTQATLIGAAVLSIWLTGRESVLTFSGMFVSDTLSMVLKVAVYAITFLVFVYSRPYLKDKGLFKGEYFVLGLFGVLGMMIMISAYSFLTLYLGLELLSLALYAMVAFNRDSARSSEAAMKYFVLGAIASGMLLYGMSILYGVTGTLDLLAVNNHLLQHATAANVPLVFGLSFIVVGVAFKLGAVPFHMWMPDVYEGAPTSVTLYIGSAPKIAAFAMAIRLLVDGLGTLVHDWQQMLIILSVLSMVIGNLVAIAQTNIKRMLAYSTISHVGFILLGVLSGLSSGYAAAMFYTLIYAIMTTGAFGVLLLMSRQGFEAEKLSDLKGLNDRNPWYAFIMLLLMFSMAGVPPTVGFYAKLVAIQAVLQINMVWLALVAVVFSIVGAFYYLRVVKFMYFDKPESEEPLAAGVDVNILLGANGLLMLGLGIFPGFLMSICASAFTG